MKKEFSSFYTEKQGSTNLVLEIPYTVTLNAGLIESCANVHNLITCVPQKASSCIHAEYAIGCMESIAKKIRKEEFGPYQMKLFLIQLCQVLCAGNNLIANTVLLDADRIFWEADENKAYFLSVPVAEDENMNDQLKAFLGELFGTIYTHEDRIKQVVAMQYLKPDFTAAGFLKVLQEDCADIREGGLGFLRKLFGQKQKPAQKAAEAFPEYKAPAQHGAEPAVQPAPKAAYQYGQPVQSPVYEPARQPAQPNCENLYGAPAGGPSFDDTEIGAESAPDDDDTYLLDAEPAPRMQLRYELTLQDENGNLHTASEFPCVVGRSEADARCLVSGAGVSRVHCTLLQEEDRLYVQDSGSKFGTFVDGEQLTGEAKELLTEGTVLVLGRARFVVSSIREL